MYFMNAWSHTFSRLGRNATIALIVVIAALVAAVLSQGTADTSRPARASASSTSAEPAWERALRIRGEAMDRR